MTTRTFQLVGRTVHRMGFGAMQLPGPGVFGPPADRGLALAVLRRAVDAGVDHIDTAQFYGPDVANDLIREALHPYPDDVVLVTKVGARRSEQGEWLPDQRPDQLRAGVDANRSSLGLDQIPVVNLRRIPEAGVPLEDQLGAMVSMRDEGLIGGIGLSNVTLDDYSLARAKTEIACVQNSYNLVDREYQQLLDNCEVDGVPFVPFFPLGSAFVADNPVLHSPAVEEVADRLSATPAQVALAWLLALAPNVLLIPGTSSRQHLDENLAAADLELDAEALLSLGQAAG